jgi:hypothetical protein
MNRRGYKKIHLKLKNFGLQRRLGFHFMGSGVKSGTTFSDHVC